MDMKENKNNEIENLKNDMYKKDIENKENEISKIDKQEDERSFIEKPSEGILKRENFYILACTALLGILFNILFYEKPLGISYPIFIIVFYCSLFLNMKDKPKFKLDFKWLLCIPILALSLTYVIYSNEIFMVLNFMAIPILIIAHTVLLTSNNIFKWYETGFLLDLLFGFFARPLGNLFKPFSMIIEAAKMKGKPGRFSTAGRALLGVIIAIPLLAVILSLLSSADEVFNNMMEQFPNFLDNVNFNEFAGRFLLVIIVTCLFFSYLWSLYNVKLRKPAFELKRIGFIDPVTVITILVMVNAIYIVFTFIQFTYLFGSLEIGLPDNFTYAEYARRGFFELVAVTLVNLAILLGNINFVKRSGNSVIKGVKILNTILVVCTLIILVSAHFRMSLYEEAYGYTYLRILTHLFMLYLFILLAATLYKIWYEKMYLLKSYIVISLIAFTMINYINIDSIIAKNNIERYKKDSKLDILYLTTLSYDAVPYLTDFLEDGIDGEAAAKLKESLLKKKKRLDSEKSWQGFNISEYLAKRSLSKLSGE